jgi:kynurenine formamidase
MNGHRVCFDFEVDFSNGGGLQGQDFRLDIQGEAIDDDALAASVIADLGLLMVGAVRILNKRIIRERHKRSSRASSATGRTPPLRFIDLSRPARNRPPAGAGSADRPTSHPSDGEWNDTEAESVLLAPVHQPAEGEGPFGLRLDRLCQRPAVVIRVTGAANRAIDWTALAATPVENMAVLIDTGGDQSVDVDGPPFLTSAAARDLRDRGAALVGIDRPAFDDVRASGLPAQTILLDAGIPVVTHLTGLDRLPGAGFTFSAVPTGSGVRGASPVRAYAALSDGPAEPPPVP